MQTSLDYLPAARVATPCSHGAWPPLDCRSTKHYLAPRSLPQLLLGLTSFLLAQACQETSVAHLFIQQPQHCSWAGPMPGSSLPFSALTSWHPSTHTFSSWCHLCLPSCPTDASCTDQGSWSHSRIRLQTLMAPGPPEVTRYLLK